MGDDGWCTIESDPGVFTELLAAFGAKDLQVEELYSLDDDSLAAIKPIYGLVFLFKWQEAPEDAASPVISEDPGIFFANQVVNNACATQALIQILLNKTDEIDVGPELGQFKEFSAEMTTDLRGRSARAPGHSGGAASAHAPRTRRARDQQQREHPRGAQQL